MSAKAGKPGEWVYLDLSKVTVSKKDGSEVALNKKKWKSIVDEALGKKWSDFTPSKSGMVEPTCEWLNLMKKRGIPVKIIWLDLGSENMKLEKRVKLATWQGLQPVDFEFTS